MQLQQMIEEAQRGNADAMAYLYTNYVAGIMDLCMGMTHNRALSEDLTHDTFLVAFTSLHQLRDKSKFGNWLNTIAKNLVLHYQTSDESSLVSSLDDKLYMISEEVNAEQPQIPTMEELLQHIEELPKGYRQVFKLAVLQGMSHKEIGELLGISSHTSSSQLLRAKRQLRDKLAQYQWLLIGLVLVPVGMFVLWHYFSEEETVSPPDTPKVADTKKKDSPKQDDMDKETTETTTTTAPIVGPSVSDSFVSQQTVTAPVVIDVPVVVNRDTVVVPANQEPEPVPGDLEPEKEHNNHIAVADSNFTAPEKPMEIIPVYHTNKENNTWDVALAYNGGINNTATISSPSIIYLDVNNPIYSSTNNNNSSFSNWSEYVNNLIFTDPEGRTDKERMTDMVAENNISHGHDEIIKHKHHDRPLTLSLSLRHMISSKFGIQTGLSYTRLSSEFYYGEPENALKDQYHIHYMGIPVALTYHWWNHNKMNCYSIAGFQTEWPVYSKTESNIILQGKSVYSEKTHLKAPWQWSLQMGVGMEYRFTPTISIYAEPGFQYFIPTNSQVETWRTEHPFSFTLPLGLRITW